jgi:hypothetical protein
MNDKKAKFVMAGRGSDADYLAFSSEVGRRIYASQLDRRICERLGIYTVSHLTEMPTLLPQGLTEMGTPYYLIEASENHFELAKLWQETKLEACLWLSVEQIISERLRPFPKADFERFGDRNWLGDVSKVWFDKLGTNIDVQAMELSENDGLDVSVDNIVEFVKVYKPNSYKNAACLRKEAIEARWFEVVGFRIKDYYVEHLLKMCEYVPCFSNVECPF